MVSRALGLQPGELRRAVPFFAVYLVLFTALTIADGAAVSLLASHVSPAQLPRWYALTACGSLLAVGGYLCYASRHPGGRMFLWILGGIAAALLLAWTAATTTGGTAPLGTLFIVREIAMTMVLMHFGTFIQDYFLRSELDRLLPIIYAGGRVGGIIGGGLLVHLAPLTGTLQLVLVAVVLFLVGATAIRWISQNLPPCEETASLTTPPDPATTSTTTPSRRRAVADFLRLVVRCPLLASLTITTLLFVGCRWVLAYQYTASFENHFADDVALTHFIGRYTQIALGISLLLQLFVVNRLVAWLGVGHTHTLYAGCVLAGMLGNLALVGLPIAIASRFLESELRFGLRNPVNQMMVNRFDKSMRIAVRGWSLGWLIPLGTLATAGLLAACDRWGGAACIAWLGVMLACGFVASSIAAGRTLQSHGGRMSKH